MRCERNGNGVMDAKMLNVQCAAFANGGGLVRAPTAIGVSIFFANQMAIYKARQDVYTKPAPRKGPKRKLGRDFVFCI